MAEDILNESFPDMKELESKVGRKTPESLLIWMRDAAADCGDRWSPAGGDRGDRADGFTDKLNNLKQEMRWLRSADVRILRQLVAVHEGIEAMRWLMEERGPLTSRGSSLTGSLSSLVTVEEACTCPRAAFARERSSSAGPLDVTETTGEEPEYRQLHADDGHTMSAEASPRHPSDATSGVSCSSRDLFRPADHSVSASFPESQLQHTDAALLRDSNAAADPIRGALLRSFKATGRDVKAAVFVPTRQPGETQTPDNKTEEDESMSSRDDTLLGYDAQWCWVESQDDVTFL